MRSFLSFLITVGQLGSFIHAWKYAQCPDSDTEFCCAEQDGLLKCMGELKKLDPRMYDSCPEGYELYCCPQNTKLGVATSQCRKTPRIKSSDAEFDLELQVVHRIFDPNDFDRILPRYLNPQDQPRKGRGSSNGAACRNNQKKRNVRVRDGLDEEGGDDGNDGFDLETIDTGGWEIALTGDQDLDVCP